MKTINRFIYRVISFSAAALIGNWLGGELRYLATGERVQTVQFKHTTSNGRTYRNIPVATKFYPALLFSGAGRPRVLFVFLGGVLAGALVPDWLEAAWLERMVKTLEAVEQD